MLEVLDCPLVFFSCLARSECSQIFAPPRLRIFLSSVQAVTAALELPDHLRPPRSAECKTRTFASDRAARHRASGLPSKTTERNAIPIIEADALPSEADSLHHRSRPLLGPQADPALRIDDSMPVKP